MKYPALRSLLVALLLMGPELRAQSLELAWDYTYTEAVAGKQIIFFTPINSGSDASVAFVATRGDGGGGNLENRIFWLRVNEDGSSPTTPLWVSDWTPNSGFTDIVAVRRNHLAYISGRQLRSVVIDANGATTVSTVETFSGETEGGDPLVMTVEQARAPGFVFSIAPRLDKRGFTLKAFRFTPAPPAISGVPTFTSINGDSLSISFQTDLGVNYQIQSSTSLTAASWQNEGGVIAGNGQLQTILQAAGVPRLFFRVVAL